jgi:hypothetical protein
VSDESGYTAAAGEGVFSLGNDLTTRLRAGECESLDEADPLMREAAEASWSTEGGTMADDRTDTELINKLADLGTPHWLVLEVEARLAAAVRRVAPDLRKFVERALFELRGNSARSPESVRAMELLSDGLASTPVTPDRETIEHGLHVAMMGTTDGGFLADDDEIPVGEMFRLALEYLDTLLASGVLGVPADQRTADRETIAEAIWRSDLDYTPNPEAWAEVRDGLKSEYFENADAVLAVLVPADQVRAEALEAAADKLTEITFIGSANWLRARAAEYRKVAGA